MRFDLPWGALPGLLVPGVVIAVVGFAEPAAIARTLAIRERRSWNADREFIGQGAANVAAAVSGGYPVGGSLSRTSLNHAAGAATRFSGAVTGIAVLLFLPFATTLESLPSAVLAAIVIVAVLGLLQPRRLVVLWAVSRPQAAIAWTTFVATLAFAPHVERAVITGVVVAILVHLVRELTLHVTATASGDVLDIRLAGVLWFATAPSLPERVVAALERHPDVTRLQLDLVGLGRIDVTGAMTLDRLVEDARRAGLSVEVRRVPTSAQGLLKRYQQQRRGLA
jgi:SulP family sulfate permease